MVTRIAILIPTLVGCALVARRLARGAGAFDLGKCIAAMPDNAPPKWIFTNVTAIRDNTERILELLERQSPAEPEAHTPNPSGG